MPRINQCSLGTYHSAGFVSGINDLGQGQNAANSYGNVGSVVPSAVDVVKLPNQFQLKASAMDDFTPDL